MGIMITASHNKYTDNGIKIAGLNGESIDSEWEGIYTVVINSKNLVEDIKIIIGKIYQKTNKNKYFFRDNIPILNFAYDTRRSSEELIKILTECVQIYGAKYKIYGVQTSPALQFMTLLNQMAFKKVNHILSQFSFADEAEYWNFLGGIYMFFNNFYDQFYKARSNEENKYESELLIDCANGAAGYNYKKISQIFNGQLKLDFINTNYKNFETLNSKCGAEHVHKEKLIPINYPEGKNYSKNVSFDGDVDRIIYL
jgi:phosphoacetylglucosamine mutase